MDSVTVPLGNVAPTALVEWGVAARVRAGESACGDRHVVREFPGGVLMAAVDGLGHGEQAAAAARLAAAVLEEHAQQDLVVLIQRCHEALAGSRGAVMSLASLDGASGVMSWLGVGNVEGVLVRARSGAARRQERLLLRGGVVGSHLPPLKTTQIEVRRDDLLALATDGIRTGFAEPLGLGGPPRQIAERILAEHGRHTDDALVLVARFMGKES